jgi:hypothetical protein
VIAVGRSPGGEASGGAQDVLGVIGEGPALMVGRQVAVAVIGRRGAVNARILIKPVDQIGLGPGRGRDPA